MSPLTPQVQLCSRTPARVLQDRLAMLAGRCAIVTGAGRGVGAATALLLGREGAKVVVNDLDAEVAEATVSAVHDAGGDAIALGGSVSDHDFPDRLVDAAMAYGGPDIIVNNAGFLWDGMLHKMSDAQWDAIIACHVTAPFRIIRAAAPHLREAAKADIAHYGMPRDRSIVNVSSTSGLHGNVGQANYAAAKAGITGLTKTVSKEWGPLGVRANAVAFGMIDTRMTNSFTDDSAMSVGGEIVPQGLPAHVAKAWQNDEHLRATVPLARKGAPEEAANAIFFLASPLASYVTGHTLEVTGGFGI